MSAGPASLLAFLDTQLAEPRSTNVLRSSVSLLAFLDTQVVRYAVWTGLVVVTGVLLVLARTRWGHSNPLRKCIVLSLLAHLLVAIYATTVHIVTAGPRGGAAIRVTLVVEDDENADGESAADATSDKRSTAESPATSEPPPSETDSAEPPSAAVATDGSAAPQPAENVASDKPDVVAATEPAPSPRHEDIPPPEPAASQADDATNEANETETASDKPTPPAESQPAATLIASTASVVERPAEEGPSSPPAAATSAEATGWSPAAKVLEAGSPPKVGVEAAPRVYALRMAHDRVRVAEQYGGSEETEAAVGAALKFLADNQSLDGRWNPRAFGAGRQNRPDGPDRQGVGSRADAGITGLAILALQAAGHTHLDGEYSERVRNGLEYLLGAQAADGSLCGPATLYERMYCHGMAAFALSEAFAMTGDERLQGAVRRAIDYTLRSQRAGVGGWRYQPGESGDMSQFGWQAMALKSAELGGIAIPGQSRAAMQAFLTSVSSGRQGGLAGYRPGHPATRPMTAEALVCRQFMGQAQDDPKSREAGEFLLEELPGAGERNVYYWYYGTLGMYQLQGDSWRAWNAALQSALLSSQRRDGDLAGSWDPDPVWGGYGGRAYSTALSALCLEVYYRFLPLYAAHGEAAKP